jgi:prolyl-tRNA synthetase
MRASVLFGDTLREVPSQVDMRGQQLLFRAGYVRQLASGIFSYLPLAWRSLRKIEKILREEMDAIGGQEINMPIVHPSELWEESGRWSSIDEAMVRFKDRRGRRMLLAMTHEEVIADLARSEVHSYRQLPVLLYQIQTKFRDEPRARGSLIRAREFVMKDSYSLDADDIGLREQYSKHYYAYSRIFGRVALPMVVVASDVGIMGGKVAHEFMYVTPMGEDTLVLCTSCPFAANADIAAFAVDAVDGGPPRAIEKVYTPNMESIPALAEGLKMPQTRFLKVICFLDRTNRNSRLLLCCVRGDMEANVTKIQNLVGTSVLEPAQVEDIRAIGAEPGYASPIGVHKNEGVLVIVDPLVASASNLVAGANEKDYHLLNTCYGRDYDADLVADISMAFENAKCVMCGQPLRITRGIELGNIFQLGTRYSSPMHAVYVDETGQRKSIVMGSYGIGLGRMLGCIAEEHNDDLGLALPITVSPFDVTLLSLAGTTNKQSVCEITDQVYDSLRQADIDVLYDDRDVSAGVKFTEADLRGIPIRITISERSLKQGGIELKHRTRKDSVIIKIGQAVDAIQKEINSLIEEINRTVEMRSVSTAPTQDGLRFGQS